MIDYSAISAEEFEALSPHQRDQVPMNRKIELLKESDEEGISMESPETTVGDLSDKDLMKALTKNRGESDEDYEARISRSRKARKSADSRHGGERRYG